MDSTLPLSSGAGLRLSGSSFPQPDSIYLAMVSVYLNASSCTYMTLFAYDESRHELGTNLFGSIRERNLSTDFNHSS